MNEAKKAGSHGQKEHKGRWKAIDAGVDLSDDQVLDYFQFTPCIQTSLT